MRHFIKHLFSLLILLSIGLNLSAQDENKLVIIIIDGARYSETFGDTDRIYTPNMWELADQGAIANKCYNKGVTKTYRAIPALWAGSYTPVFDTVYNGVSNNYSKDPSIFEYYRKDLNEEASDCQYIMKDISNPWLQSFDEDYGPEYWPYVYNHGYDDTDVTDNAIQQMENENPKLVWIYLADVDHFGHTGIWDEYINSITIADIQVKRVWNYLQADPFYSGQTTLLVTNDHGRHDDSHGGFQHHGCSCEGCEHIQFLALGPKIKTNYISEEPYEIIDMAVTASYLLNINPAKADGVVMYDLLVDNGIASSRTDIQVTASPNPFTDRVTLSYTLLKKEEVSLQIFDALGRTIFFETEVQNSGPQHIVWKSKNLNSGIYYYRVVAGEKTISGKLIK